MEIGDLHPEVGDVLEQCFKQYPDFEVSPVPEPDEFDPLGILKDANLELKKLATSKAPERMYEKDFALSEKARLAAAERATNPA